MATKTILATTETRATFAVSGDFTPGSVDFDMDVDTLGRDETAENPECIILWNTLPEAWPPPHYLPS